MRILIEKSEIVKILAKVSSALVLNPTTPSLAGIKIKVENKKLNLIVSDGDLSISETIDVEKAEDGECLVLGKKFIEVVSKMPGGEIEIWTDESRLHITKGATKFAITLMILDQYYSIPEFPKVIGKVNTKDFTDAINSCLVSIIKGDIHPQLCGVLFEIEKEKITLVSTDRYRLTKREIPFAGNLDVKKNVLVRGSSLATLLKSVADDETVTLAVDTVAEDESVRLFGLSTTTIEITSLVLDADKYPPVASIFPKEFHTFVTVNTSEFIEAIDRALVVAAQNQVVISITDKSVVLNSGDSQEAEGGEEIDAKVSGTVPEFNTILNPQFLIDGLRHFSRPFIMLKIESNAKPIEIISLDSLEDQSPTENRYLLVPIKAS
jgi:DNA polymerase-3 subunit beta